MDNINEYLDILYLQEEFEILNEFDVKGALSRLVPYISSKNLFQNIDKNLNVKKPIESMKKIKKLLPPMPEVSIEAMEKFISSKFTEFKGLMKTSSTVLDNSLPGASEYSKNLAAFAISFSSLFKGKDEPDDIKPKDKLKQNIKNFVYKTRKFSDMYESNNEIEKKSGGNADAVDIAVASVAITGMIVLALGLIAGGIFIVPAISHLISALPFLIILAIIGYTIYMVVTIAAAMANGGA